MKKSIIFVSIKSLILIILFYSGFLLNAQTPPPTYTPPIGHFSIDFTNTDREIIAPQSAGKIIFTATNIEPDDIITWTMTGVNPWITVSETQGTIKPGEVKEIVYLINWEILDNGSIQQGAVDFEFVNSITTYSGSLRVITSKPFPYDSTIPTPTPPFKVNTSYNPPVNDPSIIVDGKFDKAWGVPGGSQWVSIDMNQEKTLEAVKIHWSAPYMATNFDIYVSHDALNWTKVYSETQNSSPINEITGEVTCRYVGLIMTSSDTNAYGIVEIELIEKDLPSIDLTKLSVVNPGVYKNARATKMKVYGNYLYSFEPGKGLCITNIKDKKNAYVAAIVPETDRMLDFTIRGNIVLVSCGTFGLKLVNISDPYHPVVTATLTAVTADYNYEVLSAIFYNDKYVIAEVDAVYIGPPHNRSYPGSTTPYLINIENPFKPVIVKNFANEVGKIKDMRIKDGYLYIQSCNGTPFADVYSNHFYVFDVSNLDTITKKSELVFGWPESGQVQKTCVVGELNYLLDDRNRVQLFMRDKADLVKPFKFLSIILLDKDVSNMHASKDKLFIFYKDGTIDVYDYSLKNAPKKLLSVTNGTYYGMLIRDKHVYINEETAGLMILKEN